MVCSYIDNLLVMNKNEFLNHLKALEKVSQKLMEAVLKVNAENSFFICTETDYLGFWVLEDGVRSLLSKV